MKSLYIPSDADLERYGSLGTEFPRVVDKRFEFVTLAWDRVFELCDEGKGLDERTMTLIAGMSRFGDAMLGVEDKFFASGSRGCKKASSKTASHCGRRSRRTTATACGKPRRT